MTSLAVRPVSGSLGAEITGLDLSKPLDAATAEAVKATLAENKVIFFRDQDLTPEQHLAFGQALGDPFLDHPPYLPALEGHPAVVELSGQEGGRADIWHTDVTINEHPPSGAILVMRDCPSHGGDTIWTNTTLAYEMLSERMKSYLDGLEAHHDLSATIQTIMRERTSFEAPKGGQKTLEKATASAGMPTAVHPVVRTHPITDRKNLFVNPTFTSHILGIPAAEGQAVLDFLYAHMIQPEFQCRWSWRKGDVGMWDNYCTMHYAVTDYGDAQRVIHRVSLKGARPV